MNSTRNPAARKSGRRPLHGAGINLFYVPALLILILFTVWPLLSGIQLSFTNWDGYSPTKLFVGLSNYVTMFKDHNFATVLVNTLIYGVGSTIVQQVIGLALALLLNSKIKGRNIMRAVIYLPALVSAVIMGTMYYFVFQYQQGALNTMMVALGLPASYGSTSLRFPWQSSSSSIPCNMWVSP
jgi:raffinose/stachyose/melibiose transport system permease protein